MPKIQGSEEVRHTPGPWSIDASGELVIGSASTGTQASDFSNGVQDYPEALANLKLAAAAPELLEALEDALDYRRDAFEGDESVSGADLVEFFSIWRERAKNAIAKAEGRG